MPQKDLFEFPHSAAPSNWEKFVDETVNAYCVARQAKLDAVLEEPFDAKAHSTWVQKGTRVGYSRRFLKSIGCGATDPMWFARGRVHAVRTIIKGKVVIASVTWEDANREEWPEKVNIANLAPVGPNLAFCGD